MKGEGEEDETTLHEIRCKLYKYAGGPTPSDLGTSLLKLNSNSKSTPPFTRFLARQEGSGKITMNVRLSTALKIQIVGAKQRDINVLTPESVDGEVKVMRYAVRTGGQEAAKAFVDAVNGVLEKL